MPPNQREIRETQRRLMNKHKVKFLGPIESLREEDQPANYRTIVSHIRQLGRTDFAQYHESITVDANERPWREQIRRRAQRIAGLAKRCLEARKNETGWRMALESEVVARFTVEVACRKCRGRLWRSEQEVAPASAEEDGIMPEGRSLRKRQEKRAPCMCRSDRHMEDPIEQGINPLFDDLADEAIVYSEELRSELPKRDERPDRVYGLRRTQRLDRILSMQDKRSGSGGKYIDETLRTTPFRADGEPILFPFLIMEAKSEKGDNSFTDIEVQTAFAIRELLLLQQELRQSAEVSEDWEGGPLVWFLSNKGEQWRVSIGYMDLTKSEPRFLVTRLWHGNVDSTEDALRLLLIVDYICDWARDIYRESVVQCLRSLIVGDSRSLSYDTDVFSTIDRVDQWDLHDTEDQNAARISTALQEDRDPLRTHDTSVGVIRDARYIRMRFIALYITADNVNYLLESRMSEMQSFNTKQTLITLLKSAWPVTKEGLDNLESFWTGKAREGTDLFPPGKKFFFTGTLSAYISPDWQPTLELACIAVADDVLNNLSGVGNKADITKWLSFLPLVKSEELETLFGTLSRQPASDILFACVKRVRLSSVLESKSESGGIKKLSLRHFLFSGIGGTPALESSKITPGLDKVHPDGTGKVQDFIYVLYKRHQIGREEPSSSIFRLSSRIHMHNALRDPQQNWRHRLVSPYELPKEKDHDFLFATSERSSASIAFANRCVFVMNPAIINSSLFEHIAAFTSTRQALVKRFDHHPGWAARSWNKDILMVQDKDFFDFITSYMDTLRALGTIPSVHIGPEENTSSASSTSAKRTIIVIHDSDSEGETAKLRLSKRRRRDSGGLLQND
ncbi:hypothetical protein PT974_07625 [Cladobotryum mycophilum]|uniref:Uncharacterized protein n=1 Tax=Cladobotryum mycophilum TaxID=491253 RepID=A0ABR0SPS3_9HYPO